VKTLYTSDLHGEIYLYHQLLELTMLSSVEIVVLGGDLLPSVRQIEQCHAIPGFSDHAVSSPDRLWFELLILIARQS
jgi:Icc-related predicted phosphoesterase